MCSSQCMHKCPTAAKHWRACKGEKQADAASLQQAANPTLPLQLSSGQVSRTAHNVNQTREGCG